MRIAYKEGKEPIKKKRNSSFNKEVEDFKKIFIMEHNRKIKNAGNAGNKKDN